MNKHIQDFSTFSLNESRRQGILFLLIDEGDVVDIFSNESHAVRAHEKLVAKKYAHGAEQRLIARGLTDDEWSDAYYEEIDAIADEEGVVTIEETTTDGIIRMYGPEEALLIVSSAKGLDPDTKEAVMAAVRLASSRSMEESMGANYVLKGGSRPYDPPKDYLMMVDGSQYRGKAGRTYDVNEFRGIRQYGVDFSGADFSGVDLGGSIFKSCSFDGCDMTGASCKGATFIGCSFVGATGTDCLGQAALRGCTFTDMDADKRMKNTKTYTQTLSETWKQVILDGYLLRAAEAGDVEKAKTLLNSGAKIDAWDEEGWTPLIWAADKGNADVVRLLLDRGADPDEVDNYNKTTLHFAAHNGHLAVIKLLIQTGADPDEVDKRGRTPIDLANANGHTEVAKLIKRMQRGKSAFGM